MEGEESPAAPSLSDQFHQMRETHDAVEDVQAQALVRELQLIKAMVADDSIDAAHAKDLRNDVYIQQLVLRLALSPICPDGSRVGIMAQMT